MGARRSGGVNGLALCSGVGGLELGIRLALEGRAPYRCLCHVEREGFAASALVARMADEALDRAPVWDDLSTFDGRAWRGRVDLVSAGYPCQPFSAAGKRRGRLDERHLWPHVARIIDESCPSLVVLENVEGHVRLGLDDVLGDLASLGFDAEWDVFSAAGVGAPHRRRRVFVLAWRVSDADRNALRERAERGAGFAQAPHERDAESRDLGVDAGDLADAESIGRGQGQPEPEGELGGRDAHGCGADDVADAASDDRRSGERGAEEGARSDEQQRGGSPVVRGRMADADGRRLESVGLAQLRRIVGEPGGQSDGRDPHGGLEGQGWAEEEGAAPEAWRGPFPPGPGADWRGIPAWAQPSICRVDDGTTDRVDQLRALGNGVVPLAAAHAVRTLARRALAP